MAEQFVAICLYYPFIDGTVEGTNVEQYLDSSPVHDRTYYGNGCPNEWVEDIPGNGGSAVSCATRIVQTLDNEDQKNGTYYHFQAATSGAGGEITTDNTYSPDTFCPLGWQMPYNGTGGEYYDKSKSWKYLLTRYNINHETDSNTLRNYPFSYVDGGYYYWNIGHLFRQAVPYTYFWSNTVKSRTNAYRFNPQYGNIWVEGTGEKTSGDAIRCASRLATSKAFHGIRVRL